MHPNDIGIRNVRVNKEGQRLWSLAKCCPIWNLEGQIDCAWRGLWELEKTGRTPTRGAKQVAGETREEHTPLTLQKGQNGLQKYNIRILVAYLSNATGRWVEYPKISWFWRWNCFTVRPTSHQTRKHYSADRVVRSLGGDVCTLYLNFGPKIQRRAFDIEIADVEMTTVLKSMKT